MRPIQLLIADVDGTILDKQKQITPATIQAVEKLRAAGILFSVTSGRPPRGMVSLARTLGLTTPMAAFNGGMIVRPDLEVIQQRTIPLAVGSEVVDYLLEMGVDAWVYRGVDWFVTRAEGTRVDRERQTVGFDPVVVPDVRGALEGAVKIVGVSLDHPLVARCEAELQHRVGAHASVSRSQPYYLDITNADANKGMVVRLNSLFLRVPPDEIAVIGDMPNDVLMFGVAGTSIAMGNASPEVKRTARHVTTSNDDEGFANAVEWYVLGHQPRTAQATLGLPSRTRACLFDLDGVLTQTAKIHAVAWKQAFDAYLREWSQRSSQPFVPFDSVTDYRKYVDGKKREDGARTFLESRDIRPPAAEIEALARHKDDFVVELLEKSHVETYEGSVRFVREVRKAGLKTAVVSSSKHCQEVLASSGLSDLFDVRVDGVVADQEHLAGKPAPDMFLAAAHALDVEPAESAIFEDALAGVEAGRAGHFGYVVGVDRLGQANELRGHGADAVVTDLAALLEPA